jgi:trans-2,3-dihydro-3-hydroxyanthranilate isomerase
MQLGFFLVDVFTREPLAGNPLAIVPDAGSLDDGVMQRVARELNQSETTFLLPPTLAGADHRLRSFTAAGVEVFGAGHNAMGAWWWLADTGRLSLRGERSEFRQEIGGELLPLVIVSGPAGPIGVEMRQSAPVAGKVATDLPALAAALRIAPGDLAIDRLPAQVVHTGAPHLLVPVRSRDVIGRLRPDADRLLALLRDVEGEGCYVFSLDPVAADAKAHARFFNPTVGIVEDPATGTAAGPLGCHLVAHQVAAEGAPIIVEQGHAMGRPSRIEVVVRGSDVRISGPAVTVAEGTLRF